MVFSSLPPSSPEMRQSDEKLIINKWWPKITASKKYCIFLYTGFFPFGIDNNDTRTPYRDAADSFGPIAIDTPIVLFQGKEDVIWVSF